MADEKDVKKQIICGDSWTSETGITWICIKPVHWKGRENNHHYINKQRYEESNYASSNSNQDV